MTSPPDLRVDKLLTAACLSTTDLVVYSDLIKVPGLSEGQIPSPEGQPASVRFASIAKITCGRDRLCGLLLVADTSSRSAADVGSTAALRHHADHLSTLLELYLLLEHNDSSLHDFGLERAQLAARNLALEVEMEERARIGAQLLFTATHDELTMLHNRNFLMDRLTNLLEKSKLDTNFRFAVLVMDMDRFKSVNDSLGHGAGDLLLIEVARRLRTSIRPGDTLTRIGGDEFAILVEGVEDIAVAERVAKRINRTIGNTPVRLGREEIMASCSIGIVQADSHDRVPEKLLGNADIAMYDAKRRKLGYSVFEQKMRDEMSKGAQLRMDLEKAIVRREFFLLYQPIWDMGSTRIMGFEALLRWQHPRRGVTLPEAFIPIAESTGLIRQIGLWVLQTACAQLQIWQQQHPGAEIEMSVNVSGEQLKDLAFTADLEETLRATAISPQRLHLEVTESVFIATSTASEEVISGIKSLGAKLSLDDFGNGYSSLTYIDHYPIDVVKIDRSFVANIVTRPRTVAIVQAVTQLGRALDVKVIAEGVETDQQRQALMSAGCRFAQGNFLGAPSSPALVLPMLSRLSGPDLTT